ncbi:MAG: PspC domain-containing protein [Gammaproteobacteria bacterium]|jgi:phage shock protein PspC (stress-responsive transcriptional regulator)|nr:PspC domain-containing protein [Gammaproteobacteria bacterium]
MQRIYITARLNGVNLQFDEAAFARLESYLAEAGRALDGNPDRAEILADLEQAIADQCRERMNADQVAVTLRHLEPTLEEIGPVQVPGTDSPSPQPARETPRRLEQVSEGALISGVCLGLARYINVDVTLLRVIAVLLLFLSGGGVTVVYVVLMFLLPYAPAEAGAPPIGKIPAKSREFVEFVRAKLSVATN